MNWTAIEKRHPTCMPWGSSQNVTAYPTLRAKLVNVYISHAGTGHEIPEADSQSGNEADMVHYDKPASLFCGSDLATGEITVSNWYVALLLQDRQKLRTSGTAARWSRRWRSRLQR